MGVPLNHPFIDGIFPSKPSIWGCPHLWKPPHAMQIGWTEKSESHLVTLGRHPSPACQAATTRPTDRRRTTGKRGTSAGVFFGQGLCPFTANHPDSLSKKRGESAASIHLNILKTRGNQLVPSISWNFPGLEFRLPCHSLIRVTASPVPHRCFSGHSS